MANDLEQKFIKVWLLHSYGMSKLIHDWLLFLEHMQSLWTDLTFMIFPFILFELKCQQAKSVTKTRNSKRDDVQHWYFHVPWCFLLENQATNSCKSTFYQKHESILKESISDQTEFLTMWTRGIIQLPTNSPLVLCFIEHSTQTPPVTPEGHRILKFMCPPCQAPWTSQIPHMVPRGTTTWCWGKWFQCWNLNSSVLWNLYSKWI